MLIDNYVDDTVLSLLTKKRKEVSCIIFTKHINRQLKLDVQKFNRQYANLEVKVFDKSHDRFLMIDNDKAYHIGASLKDLGKKWFALSEIDKNSVKILDPIRRLIK